MKIRVNRKISTQKCGTHHSPSAGSNIKMTEKYEQDSPNKTYKVEFYDFDEPRMGMTICRFRLTNLTNNNVIEFYPLWAIGIGNDVSWSNDSKLFSLPIANPTDNYFIFDNTNQKFTSIHFPNCWVTKGHLFSDRIEIEFRDDQIPERKEHNKYPTKNYSKPENSVFKLSDLTWYDLNRLVDFNEINKDQTIHDLKPIDNGWRKFKGNLPTNTEVLIWELREFAEYGDKQSIEWFESIKAKTKDINYW